MTRSGFKLIHLASVSLCWLAIASFVNAQDASVTTTPVENTGPRKAAVSRPDDDLSIYERTPSDETKGVGGESPNIPPSSSVETQILGEFNSTSRETDGELPGLGSKNLNLARAEANGTNQFWALHDLMLSSVASTGQVSTDILAKLDAASLSRENKALLRARHRVLGGGVESEFSSSSRDIWEHMAKKVKGAAADLDDKRLDMMSNSPRAGRDYTKIYVRNNSGETLWVALRFEPFRSSSGESRLAQSTPDTDGPFETAGWFKFEPGERAHLASTNNNTFYYYAENKDRSIKWAGTHNRVVKGRSIGFKKDQIIGDIREYTLNLGR
jgi:hypothetical protein